MARAATAVEQALDACCRRSRAPKGRLAEAMRYAALGGGKRLRAFLVMETRGACSACRDLRRARRGRGRDAARLFAGA